DSSGRSLTSKSLREAASSSTISTRAPLVCIFVSYWSIHRRDTESLRGPNRTFGFAAVRPQRLHGELSSSSILNLRLLTQPRGYFLNKYVFIDGLRDVADTTGSQCFLSIPLHRIRSHGDYWNISRGRLCLYSSGYFKPLHSGKLDIHHNQIGPLLLDILKSFLRRRRLMHLVPLRSKQKHRQTPIHRIIFNQQNFLFSHKNLSRKGAKTQRFIHHRLLVNTLN